MTWDELASKAYNSYMLSLSKGAWCGNYESLMDDSRQAWVDVAKTVYNLANESSQKDMVDMVCKGGF